MFRYGLCVCQGLSASSLITVDAFDATMPGATTFGSGGSVGINGNINVSNTLSVGGTLQISQQLGRAGAEDRSGSAAGRRHEPVGVDVARNAGKVTGDIVVNGTLKVVGNLTYGKTLTRDDAADRFEDDGHGDGGGAVRLRAKPDLSDRQLCRCAADEQRQRQHRAGPGAAEQRTDAGSAVWRFFLNNISGSAEADGQGDGPHGAVHRGRCQPAEQLHGCRSAAMESWICSSMAA